MLKFNFKIFSIFMNNTLYNFILNILFKKKNVTVFRKEKNILFVNHLLHIKEIFLNNYIRTINYWRIVY